MANLLALDDRSMLLISGTNTKQFLQGQLTCDVQQLCHQTDANTSPHTRSQTTLGAHCTPKGRMLFSFRACQLNDEQIVLVFHHSLMPIALASLKKYSLFSRVELSDISTEYKLLGLYEQHFDALSTLFPTPPTKINEASHCTIEGHHAMLIKIDHHRYEAWLPKGIATDHLPITKGTTQWHFGNIMAGIGEVRIETSEQFIPQMLNLQVLGNGISFQKGCYTGQEIVARMAYLGKLKKRMYRLQSDDTIQELPPYSPLYQDNSVVGHIVFSCIHEQKLHCLAVISNTAINTDKASLFSTTEEQQLTLETLPYTVTSGITKN